MADVSRRGFLGAASASLAAAGASAGDPAGVVASQPPQGATATMGLAHDIAKLVDQTPLVDTHEHLWEESVRLEARDARKPGVPAPDFGMLFMHYSDSDLMTAGMPPFDYDKLVGHVLSPREKWALVEPWYARCRNTGYLLNVRESIRMLYGEDDINAGNCEAISDRLKEQVQPGFYRRLLKEIANIEYCHVNSLETPVFRDTAMPDLLCQDISTVALSSGLDVKAVTKALGREANDLKQWHELIDRVFATYGPRAIAVKNQSAYGRRLDYAEVGADEVAPLFARFLADRKSLMPAELKALQDHLFHYTIDKAAEYGLPIKLHTGYYAGKDGMLLERVRQNASDLCPVLRAHPKAKFVLMHIDYPYQDEVIALAKHYTNVCVDMCWAWIINPVAGVRFLKEFLLAAPASKLFTFGGDYMPGEKVPGHARIARRGIARAVAELVEEGWVREAEAPALVDRIMRGNAHEVFDYQRASAGKA